MELQIGYVRILIFCYVRSHNLDCKQICLYDGSKGFHDSTASKDKSFLTYQGAFHEILNEPECRDEAIHDIIEWVKKH